MMVQVSILGSVVSKAYRGIITSVLISLSIGQLILTYINAYIYVLYYLCEVKNAVRTFSVLSVIGLWSILQDL